MEWTALGTWFYVSLVALTLWYIRGQFAEAIKRRVFDTTLTIFKELQTREVRRARKYIYTRVPYDTTVVSESELQTHLEEAEGAISVFDLLGYLLREGHVTRETTLNYYWRGVWKCWKKSENLLRWARRRRHEPVFEHFDYLFEECERYRRENGYEEPRI